jgi:hypothetical protein
MDKQSVEALDPLSASSLNELIYETYQLLPRHARVPPLQYAQPLLRIDSGGAIGSLMCNWHSCFLILVRPSPAGTYTRDATSTSSENRYARQSKTRPPCEWRARGCSSGGVTKHGPRCAGRFLIGVSLGPSKYLGLHGGIPSYPRFADLKDTTGTANRFDLTNRTMRAAAFPTTHCAG